MKKEAGIPRPRALVCAAVALASWTPWAMSQGGPPPAPVTAIRGGTLHRGNGDVLENATVLVRGSRIEAVGVGLAIPEGATIVDAAGKHLYPGLIDVESALLVEDGGRGDGTPASSIADAVDVFDDRAIAEAWAGGVTTIGLVARHAQLDGQGAVIKLRSGRGAATFLRRDGDLSATFGSGGAQGTRPSMRLREWRTFLEQLQATKKYIEQWDEYAEKLADYKKELEKAKKDGDTKKPADDKKDEKKEEKKEAPAPAPSGGERPQGGPGGPGGRRRGPRPPGGDVDPEFQKLLKELEHELLHGDDPHDCCTDAHPEKPRLYDDVSFAEEGGGQQGGEAKKDEPKKPGRPGREGYREALRKALEGKLALNVYADRASDLQNLLDLLKTWPLRVIVTGAREAAPFAAQLADARIPVVVIQPHALGDDAAGTAAALDRAGVSTVLTTDGRTPGATRWLTMSAAAAIAGGMEREHALAAITSRAAALLGVGDRVGSVEAGKDADLLLASGDLFATTTVIERVWIDGRSVAPAAAR